MALLGTDSDWRKQMVQSGQAAFLVFFSFLKKAGLEEVNWKQRHLAGCSHRLFRFLFSLCFLEIHSLFLIPWRTSGHSHQGGSRQAPRHQIQVPSKVSAAAGLRHESFEISGGKIWQMVPQQFSSHTGIFGFVRFKLINLGLKNLLWHFEERRTKSYTKKRSVIKPILFCWFPCKTIFELLSPIVTEVSGLGQVPGQL